MRRDARAYLADILECCGAIDAAMAGMSLEDYVDDRLVRSSAEREFTITGEAVLALSRKSPAMFESISGARRIVDFRNRLTHEYPMVDDELVWALAKQAMPVLRRECGALLAGLEAELKRQPGPTCT